MASDTYHELLDDQEVLVFFIETTFWKHWVSQVQSSGLPLSFVRAQSWSLIPSTNSTKLTLTLLITTTKVVKTSLIVNDSPIKEYTSPDDHILPTYEMTQDRVKTIYYATVLSKHVKLQNFDQGN